MIIIIYLTIYYDDQMLECISNIYYNVLFLIINPLNNEYNIIIRHNSKKYYHVHFYLILDLI